MKISKKIACLALAVVFAAGLLSACGGTGNYAADNTMFFIGGTGPLTGDNASYGVSVNRGAQLAIDEINANGGLNGVQFKFEMKDDVAAEDKAATGYVSLYEDGMQISIGSVTSGACKSFATEALEDDLLLMTPSASAADVIAVGDHAFRVCFGDPQQGSIAADMLSEQYQKIGVIYDTSETYSSGIYSAFEEEMTKLGKTSGTDYIVYTFDKDSNKNFSTQVGALMQNECDVIFLPIYYTEAGLIVKEAARNSYNVPVFGCDGLDGIAGQLDDTVTASIQYITPFDINSTDETVSAFVEAYRAAYNTDPDQFAADGYDAVMILYNAMKVAGLDDPTASAQTVSDAVREVLLSDDFSYSGVTGKNMTWTEDGSCNKEANIVTLDH